METLNAGLELARRPGREGKLVVDVLRLADYQDTDYAALYLDRLRPLRGAGHGGMDFMMDWRLIDCLRNGLPLDQDVYDAALWSAVAPLSETSVANRSSSVNVPDFTNGAWKTNEPVDITLAGGGTTNVLLKE